MKKVGRFSSHTTAHLAKEALLSHGIPSEIVGAKEYSSIIVGGDQGRYDLMVDWKDEAEANKIIKGFDIQIVPGSEDEPLGTSTFCSVAKSYYHGFTSVRFYSDCF